MSEPRRRPRSQPGPVSDIERFLMEVERLRKKASEDKQHVDDVDVVDDVEVVRPAPPPPPPPRPVTRARPRPVEAAPVLDVVPVRPAAPVPADHYTKPAVLPVHRPSTQSGQPASAMAFQVLAMFRSRHQMRAGILLSEILGPPACRRHRR